MTRLLVAGVAAVTLAGCGASSSSSTSTTPTAQTATAAAPIVKNDPNCVGGIDVKNGITVRCTVTRAMLKRARRLESQTTTSSPPPAPDATSRPATRPSRGSVCRRFANFVGNYNYIQAGTSVRAYDILFHTLQRSCPAQAHAGGFDGDSGTPSCLHLYDNRFNCQAFNDPNFPASSTADLVADLAGG